MRARRTVGSGCSSARSRAGPCRSTGMGYFHIFASFAAVGFFYLLPTDLLFSLWFFFMVTKLEEVGATAFGYQPEEMPMYPCKLFVGYQAIGAYLVLVIAMLWAARPHLTRVWRAAVGKASEAAPTAFIPNAP